MNNKEFIQLCNLHNIPTFYDNVYQVIGVSYERAARYLNLIDKQVFGHPFKVGACFISSDINESKYFLDYCANYSITFNILNIRYEDYAEVQDYLNKITCVESESGNHEYVDCSFGGKPLVWCKYCGKEKENATITFRYKE